MFLDRYTFLKVHRCSKVNISVLKANLVYEPKFQSPACKLHIYFELIDLLLEFLEGLFESFHCRLQCNCMQFLI